MAMMVWSIAAHWKDWDSGAKVSTVAEGRKEVGGWLVPQLELCDDDRLTITALPLSFPLRFVFSSGAQQLEALPPFLPFLLCCPLFLPCSLGDRTSETAAERHSGEVELLCAQGL